MLTLTREVGQKILIGDDIVLTVVSVTANGRVKLGIDAPRQVRIDREEVLVRIRRENMESAEATAHVATDDSRWASYGARQVSGHERPKE